MNDFPRMIYRAGGTEEIHGGHFSTLIVHEDEELAAALADGWHVSTCEAREAPERERLAREAALAQAQAERDADAREQAERGRIAADERDAAEAAAVAEAAAKAVMDDNAAPTRAELEAKALELGIEFSPRIGDAKLAERIAEKLKEQA